MADLYNQLVNDRPILQGQIQDFEPLNDVALNDDWAIPSLISGGLGLFKFGAEPLLNYGKGLALSYGKPIFKLFDKSLNKFGKLGKNYFLDNIHPYKDYSKYLGKEVYYPSVSAGKTFYRYRDQFPTLRKNIRNADEGLYIKANPKYDKYGNEIPRKDATGFYNLKVNFRGKDYGYQIRQNPQSKHAEFYNIKPYNLVEKDYKEQYLNELFKYIFED